MRDNIDIEKLFSEKLANHESVVSSKVWAGIQSQMAVGASSTAVAAKGISMASKWLIGVSSVVAVTTVAVILNYTDPKTDKIIPIETLSDTTQTNADSKDAIVENKESLVLEKTKIPASIQVAETNSSPVESSQQRDGDESTSNAGEMLIVKQATPGSTGVTGVTKSNKKIQNQPDQETVKENSSVLPVQSTEAAAVQEWKKTNVFSPNNDGINDLFFLETTDLKEFSISIINEKNEVVYISKEQNFKWDGVDYRTGEIVPEGNYGYIVFAVDRNNKPVKLFNTLKISR